MPHTSSPAAGIVSASMAEMVQQMISTVPGARFLRRGGACATVTGIPTPSVNGVWAERPDPDLFSFAALLDEVAAAGVPYSLRLRPRSEEALGQLACARGMTLATEITLMALGSRDEVPAIPEPAGLTIRRLAPDESPVAATVGAAGFGVAEETFRRIVSPDLLRLNSVRCYVGEVDKRAVTTATSVTLGGFTGIFCVATLPGWRGRGFGTAITARAVADGLVAGSRWCCLEATPAGLSAYRAVGFRAIEPRQVWVSA
jgi:predicted GNAT family acetyltransferase